MADTDGVDGQEEIAGACIGPDTLSRARSEGLRPMDSLANNDGHGFFEALGASVVTGPTMTNVNDFRALLITGGGASPGLAGHTPDEYTRVAGACGGIELKE
jgi:hydroxypyruvate reductase